MERNEALALEIYQEETPNPESWKFNTSIHLLPNYYEEFKSAADCAESDLAKKLFDLPFVKTVFISNNFLTITKHKDYEWYEISPEIKDTIRKFLTTGGQAVSEALFQKAEVPKEVPADNPEDKIKELLDKYVRPAVESDGGYIEYRSFENGVVTVVMKGSCSGCPSASLTLKGGIEGLLKRMVPQVTEVIAHEE